MLSASTTVGSGSSSCRSACERSWRTEPGAAVLASRIFPRQPQQHPLRPQQHQQHARKNVVSKAVMGQVRRAIPLPARRSTSLHEVTMHPSVCMLRMPQVNDGASSTWPSSRAIMKERVTMYENLRGDDFRCVQGQLRAVSSCQDSAGLPSSSPSSTSISRHPLDQQNTSMLRSIPGLELVSKTFLGEPPSDQSAA
jgi:hypothetical protein